MTGKRLGFAAGWIVLAALAAAAAQSLDLAPRQVHARTQSVLRYLGVPVEATPDLSDLDRAQTGEGLRELLPILDPSGTYLKFAKVTPTELRVFQDADAREIPDYAVRLAPVAPGARAAFHERLLAASARKGSRAPLKGLRIALDPGHMGGDEWDRRTGKFVHDGKGNELSEGILALQVALLLEAELKALGAEVMLTHREPGTVSPIRFEDLELRPYALREIRESAMADWFRGLLAAGPEGSFALHSAFERSKEVLSMLSESAPARYRYYVLREELDARARMIRESDADIALVIHFDTSDPPGDAQGLNPEARDGTKVFVAGGFEPNELGSRESRAYLTRHLLDATAWNASLGLSRAVVDRMSAGLGIPKDKGYGAQARPLEPGIYARNLGIPRKAGGRAITYVECLYYNAPKEFAMLRDYRRSMTMGGRSYPYSGRLEQVVGALRAGVVGFVAGYGGE